MPRTKRTFAFWNFKLSHHPLVPLSRRFSLRTWWSLTQKIWGLLVFRRTEPSSDAQARRYKWEKCVYLLKCRIIIYSNASYLPFSGLYIRIGDKRHSNCFRCQWRYLLMITFWSLESERSEAAKVGEWRDNHGPCEKETREYLFIKFSELAPSRCTTRHLTNHFDVKKG